MAYGLLMRGLDLGLVVAVALVAAAAGLAVRGSWLESDGTLYWQAALAVAWSIVLAVAAYSAGGRHAPAAVAGDSRCRQLVFSVNGIERLLIDPSPSLLLSDYLRGIGLTGTKVACGEGGCGACSVIAVGADGVPRAINACLRLLCACDGLSITTTEGLGSQATGFSPVQEVIAKAGGSQCGFCTPGWVMAMTALLARFRGKTLTADQIETSLDGNLCRCTGYRPIVQAFTTAFADIEDLAPCHDVRTGSACGRACEQSSKARAASREEAVRAVAPPLSVRVRSMAPAPVLRHTDDSANLSYLRPTSLAELTEILALHPASSLVCGNTGLGVSKYYTREGPTGPSAQPAQRGATLVDISQTKELTAISTDASGTMIVGAAVSLESWRQALLQGATDDALAAPLAGSLARHVGRVANTQVRATGSWAGNLALAAGAPAFVSDVATMLAAARARVYTLPRGSKGRWRVRGVSVSLTEMSVPEYLALGRGGGGGEAMLPVLVHMEVPLRGVSVSYSDKVSLRHANAHAIVNAAFTLSVDSQLRITGATAAIGGITKRLFVPTAAADSLLGKLLTDVATLNSWVAALETEAVATGISPWSRHSPEYRLGLLRAFAYKLFFSALDARGLLSPRLRPAILDSLGAAEDRPVTQVMNDAVVHDAHGMALFSAACHLPLFSPATRMYSEHVHHTRKHAQATQEIDVSNETIAPVSFPMPKVPTGDVALSLLSLLSLSLSLVLAPSLSRPRSCTSILTRTMLAPHGPAGCTAPSIRGGQVHL